MTADEPLATPSPVRRPRGRRWPWLLLAVPPAGLALVAWWFTDPITPGSPPTAVVLPGHQATATVAVPPSAEWPTGTLTGEPAKRLLLDCLLAGRRRLDSVDGYTATFRRQERIGGVLRPEQTLLLKSRPDPFAIYFKFRAPTPGKEVVFAQGHHDNKLVAHNGDWKDKLIPRLKLDPKGSVALADSRHPITEAGLLNLTDRLIGFRRLDLADPEAQTTLDRLTDADGRTWFRAVHTHPTRHGDRPFARVEVLLDPKTYLPLRITSFDWPSANDSPTAELSLAERYAYDDLNLDARLTDLDFDPANPAYGFSRF